MKNLKNKLECLGRHLDAAQKIIDELRGEAGPVPGASSKKPRKKIDYEALLMQGGKAGKPDYLKQ